jgi:hypothetical protein
VTNPDQVETDDKMAWVLKKFIYLQILFLLCLIPNMIFRQLRFGFGKAKLEKIKML